MTIPNPEAPQQEEETPLYCISLERLDELNRSAITLLAARRSPMSPSMMKEDHELDNPQELLDEIAEYCGDVEEFISSDMPIQEIVFRTMLARRNEPISLTDLHRELTERWATPVRPIHISPRNLARILDSDDYYGFARAE
ncbi:MAG: hypothetical protein OXR67_04955 [Chloroflexota bacterium]|nr:hypothetical protein [Chloroflexota bacterium]